MNNTMTEYDQQAVEFAKKHGVKLSILVSDYKIHFAGDKDLRWVFKCKLTRKGKSYTFEFGQSIQENDNPPTLYDVFACLQKYDVGSFENFCGEFGYDTDSRTAEKTYKAVCKEFAAVERLFSDVIDELEDIQ